MSAAPIPERMQGGWIRSGIAFDGGTPTEPAVVWWLQAPSQHCDLRIPHTGTDGLMSFAGTTSWADPRLTWSPELELDPSVFTDIGVITWDGADMIEEGDAIDGDREISYVERWQRIPDSTGPLLALSREGGRLVRTGSVALTIVDERPFGGPFTAVAWRLVGERWIIDHGWPLDAVAPPPPVGLPSDDEIVLSDGLTWRVDER